MNEQEMKKIRDKILASRKYRYLCASTVEDVIREEVPKYNKRKTGEEQIRKKLHRIWAAYLGTLDYEGMEQALNEGFRRQDDAGIREICLDILTSHKSTAERLEIIADFYPVIFAETGKPATLIDLASAMNPLALRWMGLDTHVRYYAYDINVRNIELVNYYFSLEKLPPLAEVRDICVQPPCVKGDVTLFLKMYHCLEQRKRGAGLAALKNDMSRWLVVSFPSVNLARRKVPIIKTYEPDIVRYVEENGYALHKLTFKNEDVLLIKKG